MLALNTPQTRQNAICKRLDQGAPLVIQALAEELGISVDSVRRDLIALEQRGLVRRVRGGAIPLTKPSPSYTERAAAPDPAIASLADRAVQLIPEGSTVCLDAGTTLTALAARLPEGFPGLVVTPAPSVALAALNRGADVHLIGGRLCPEGAMATGAEAERAIAGIAVDCCFLGACGLWPGFGLSAEDAAEAGIKRAMALASARAVVVAAATKIGRRGRYRVLTLDEIDTLVTDASPADASAYSDAGIEVVHV